MNAIRTTRNRYLDVSILTTLPPNCVNRDDSGRPKTVVFGGAQRQSPSSQFLKRGWREASIQGGMISRSQYAPVRIAEILGLSDNPEALKNIAEVLYSGSFKNDGNNPKKVDGKPGEVKGKTSGLMLYGLKEIEACAEILRPHAAVLAGAQKPEKELGRISKEVEKSFAEALGSSPHEAALIALYGRMTTNSSLTNASDAALSVCRAMSTSMVETSIDYFTAVDDARPSESDEGAGAGHIGRKEFCNGSNLILQYRINLDLLSENAGFSGTPEQMAAVRDVVGDFLQTSLDNVMPRAANQGVFSAAPKTYAAVFRVSNGMSPDMGPAFLKPSRPGADLEDDAARMFEYLDRAEKAWGAATSTLRFNFFAGDNLSEFVTSCVETAFGGNE